MPSIQEQLDRLARFRAADLPVISLYLDTRPGSDNQEHWGPFIQKELVNRIQSFEPHTPARESFERDVQRIRDYLQGDLDPSADALAIFACAGADDFFEAVQLQVPVGDSRIYVLDSPQLYPLARVVDQYPRCAAVVLDRNFARIVVFDLGRRVDAREVESEKITRSQVGGWSQARYQRHADNIALHHAKEVVDVLDRTVRRDDIRYIVLAGDEEIIPVLRDQLPKHLQEKVIDIVHLDIDATERELLETTFRAERAEDAEDDAAKVESVLDAWRAGGLGVAGVESTLAALTRGQVDELLLSASLDRDQQDPRPVSRAVLPDTPTRSSSGTAVVDVPAQLVAQAISTGASVIFIENSERLDQYGGVAARLRFLL